MSHIRHYRALPWATGPLTLLESTAKVPDRQVAKTATSSSSSSSSSSTTSPPPPPPPPPSHRDSTTTAEAVTTIQTQNNNINHSVLHPPLIRSYRYRSTPTLMLVLIRHFARIRLFIASTPPGSSTEHVL